MVINAQAGRGRIENIATIAFISTLIALFIYTILIIVEKSEEISVEIRVKQLQSAAKWKFSELMLMGQLADIDKYNGANPFVWISFNSFEVTGNVRDIVDKTSTVNTVSNSVQSADDENLDIDNYLGSFERYNWSEIPEKYWFYDKKEGLVIYKVAYPERLQVQGLAKDRLVWRLKVVTIQEKNPFGKGNRDRAESLILAPVYPYYWGNEAKK